MSAQPIQVLLIEDNPGDALLIREVLAGVAGAPYQLIWADRLAGGRARLAEGGIQVVLLDLMLPDDQGLQALAKVRAQAPEVAIIVLTGLDDEALAVQAVREGAQDYLVKGEMDGDMLVRTMRYAVQRKQSEQALRHSEKRFRALIENSSDSVSLLAADGTILYTGPATTRMLGYPVAEFVGRNAFELLHPDDLLTMRNLFAQLERAPGHTAAAQFRYRHVDGSWRWLEGVGTNLLAEPGVQAIVVNFRDITEAKEAEAQLRAAEAKYRSLVEQLPAVTYIVTFGDVNRTTYISPQIETLLGFSPEEWLADPDLWIRQIQPDDREWVLAEVRRADEGGAPLNLEYRVLARDGRESWVRNMSVVVPDATGKALYSHGFLLDITERKQHEREQEALLAVARGMRTASNRAEMLPVILDQLLNLLKADGAALATRDPASGETVFELGRGEWAEVTDMRLPPGQGVSGLVIDTGQPYRNKDARTDPQFARPDLLDHIRAVAGVPLIAHRQTLGGLLIGRARDFTDGEVRLLAAVADIAANAIHRTTLHEQTERRLQRLAALRNIDMALTASFDLRLTFNVILEQVTTQLHVDAADVLQLKANTYILEYAAGRGFRSRAVERSRQRLGEGYAGRAAADRRPIHLPELTEEEPDFARTPFLAAEDFHAYYVVPLIVKGQVQGVLEVFHRTPLNPDTEWLEFLETLAGQAGIAIDNAQLWDEQQRSNSNLTLAYDTTLEGWSRALDLRDKETEGHSRRVTAMTVRLAEAMGVSDDDLTHVRWGALLHDIGKMGIPDSILLKPGPLTREEWAIMCQHPVYAYELLGPIAYLRQALDIPYCHHEKWDGTGYPRGLKGEQIPLAARIFAVVDVWDALLSGRPYRAAWPEEKARAYLREQAGAHFDPQVVELFLRDRDSLIP